MQEIEKLYEEYYQIVYKYLLCLTKNSDIAEELTQETFYKVIKKIHTFKGKSKFSVWICEIAKNLWYDELRKKKYKIVSYDEIKDYNINQKGNDIEKEYISKETIKETNEKIEKLDIQTKKVMYLRLKGDMSFKEIGVILGKTETWARVTFYRGKQRIKEESNNEK